MEGGPDDPETPELDEVRRLLDALAHHPTHDGIDSQLARLAAQAAQTERRDVLEVLLAPAPDRRAGSYLLRPGLASGWEEIAVSEHADPVEAWLAFEQSTRAVELVALAPGLERRVAARQPAGQIRFLDIDELAVDGPRSRNALDAWRGTARTSAGAAGVAPADVSLPGTGEVHAKPAELPAHLPEGRRRRPRRPASVTIGLTFTPSPGGPAPARPHPAPAPEAPGGSTAPAAPEAPGDTEPPRPLEEPPQPAPQQRAGELVEPTADLVEPAADQLAQLRARTEAAWQRSQAAFGEWFRAAGGWKLVYACLGVAAAAMVFTFIRFTLDDAFITWRYGRTFVHTGHWNWNPQGPRVEAYTNPLYAFASVVPALLRIDAELFFKVVSLGLLAAYVAGVHRLRLPKRQELILLAVALLSPVFYVQLFGGLETASFALGIAALFGALYRNGRLGRWGFVAAGVVALSRPEGIVFAALAAGLALALEQSRSHLAGAAAVAGGWVAYWIWRWQHFGWFFPNSFYTKAATGSAAHQVADTASALVPVLVFAVLAGLVALLFAKRTPAPRRPLRQRLQDAVPLLLAAVSAVIVLGLYKHADLVMDPANRFYWQLLFPVVVVVLCRPLGVEAVSGPEVAKRFAGRDLGALLGVAVAIGAAVAWGPVGKSPVVLAGAGLAVFGALVVRSMRRTAAAAAVGALALAVGIGYLSVNESMIWLAYRYRLEAAHEAFGHVLAAAKPRGAITMFDAGILPYELGGEVIDTGGLGSAQVAHRGLRAADLKRAHTEMVILGFGSPALSPYYFGGRGAVAAYAYAVGSGFWSSAGPMFGPGYYLNYFIAPRLALTGLPQKIAPVTAASEQANARPNADIFLDNLWHFPFLSR